MFISFFKNNFICNNSYYLVRSYYVIYTLYTLSLILPKTLWGKWLPSNYRWEQWGLKVLSKFLKIKGQSQVWNSTFGSLSPTVVFPSGFLLHVLIFASQGNCLLLSEFLGSTQFILCQWLRAQSLAHTWAAVHPWSNQYHLSCSLPQ